MAATESTMLPLGTQAPDFSLADTRGNAVSLGDLAGTPALLVAFICNHCPYVLHLRNAFAELAAEYAPRGVNTVAINANDASAYPDDAPARMCEAADQCGFVFPYLFDETQDVAKAYCAACTPDFYVFDDSRRLVYRGQFDDSRPRNGRPVTGADLRAALDALLAGEKPAEEQRPSIGCGIKWRPGNAPAYAA